MPALRCAVLLCPPCASSYIYVVHRELFPSEPTCATPLRATAPPCPSAHPCLPAMHADVCIFFVGTASAFPFGGVEERQHYGSYASFSPVVEAEGLDRTDLLLPGHQLDLVQVRAQRREGYSVD